MAFFDQIADSGFLHFLSEAGIVGSRSSAIKILLQRGDHDARFLVSDNGKAYFVRFTTQLNEFRLTAEVNNFLADNGLNVIPIVLYGETFEYKGKPFRVDVRPFFTGRPYNGSLEDYQVLLDTLAPIHNALRDYPGRDAIKRTAGDFTRNLEETRIKLLEGKGEFSAPVAAWLGENKAFIQEHLSGLDMALGLDNDAQCLHGDLHTGNVIFTDTGKALIFDLEESYKVYLNKAYDMAYVYERFCLQQVKEYKELLQRFNMLSGSAKLDISFENLLDVIGKMSLRLILIVFSNYFNKGSEVPVEELDKFLHNHTSINNYKTQIH